MVSLEDIKWAINALRARAHRRNLMFSARSRFDDAFKPHRQGAVMAYPEAFYHTSSDDLCRAVAAGQRGNKSIASPMDIRATR